MMNHRGGETFEQRVARLCARTSENGWKGPGSIAVRESTWKRALELVRIVHEERRVSLERPFVSAGADGSVCLRWRAGATMLEVEVHPDGSIDWQEDGPSGFDSGENEDGPAVVQRIEQRLCA